METPVHDHPCKSLRTREMHERARTRKSAIPDTDADTGANNVTKELTLDRKD